jgi:DNA-directed RNA polymerase specialized sigma24 family protein
MLQEKAIMSKTVSPGSERTRVTSASEREHYLTELKGHMVLVLRLDRDEERAWEKYNGLRARLGKFFECRKCLRPLELADRTLDRVAAKLGNDAQIRDVAQFCIGVARKILLEDRRDARVIAIGDMPGGESDLPDMAAEPMDADERVESERRLACLEKCLAKLEPDDRKLILLFYSANEKEHIEFRRQLANTLDITLGNLRVRACRLRARLETCVLRCLNISGQLRNES